jgi:hypothetical protein
MGRNAPVTHLAVVVLDHLLDASLGICGAARAAQDDRQSVCVALRDLCHAVSRPHELQKEGRDESTKTNIENDPAPRGVPQEVLALHPAYTFSPLSHLSHLCLATPGSTPSRTTARFAR